MSDLDKRLEGLVVAAEKHDHAHGRAMRGGERRPAVCESCLAERRLTEAGFGRVLVAGRPTFPAAAALLRARGVLRELGVGLTPDVSQRCATAALADPELEEVLR